MFKHENLMKYFSVLFIKILQFSSWIWDYLLKKTKNQIIHFKMQWTSLVVLHWLPIFFFLVVLGFELGLTLARQALYHFSHFASPFLCWVFSR
jgi:hypothetical protein